MAAEFEVIEKELGNVVEIEEKAPMWKMDTIMGRNFGRIFSYLESQNCKSVDAPYARYLNIDWEAQMAKSMFTNFLEIFTRKWHFRVGVTTSDQLEGEGDMMASVMDKRKFVQGIHRGPYQRVGKTYRKMFAWLKEQGLTADTESIELYLNDPRETRKEDLETLVLIPIADAK